MTFRARGLALAGCLLSASVLAQPLGDAFRVNTYTSGDQDSPGAALDAAGNFVVTWRSHGPYGALNGPRGQRYAATGGTAGGEFSAQTDGSYFTNGGVAVGSDSAGNFVVVWSDYGVPGEDKLGLFGQRYAPSGAEIGGAFRVNTYTTGDQSGARVAMNATGDFVVVWISRNEDGDKDGVFGRRFAPDGTPRGDPFLVNTYTTGSQTKPRVAITSAGDFVVAWQSTNGQPLYSVYGRRFAASGAPSGAEFRVNTHIGGGAYSGDADVAAAPAGGFVVVWRTNYLGNNEDIFSRRFSAAGLALGAELTVNVSTGTFGESASIAALGTTGYVVTWAAGGNDKLVLGRLLSSVGTPLGPEFVVNTYTSGRAFFPIVAANASRKFVVTWSSAAEDGSDLGVYARRFSAYPNGDANADGTVDINDIFYLINYLFAGGLAPLGPADVDANLDLDINDVFYLINYLYAGGPTPL
jgi:hypothetical protein